MRGSLSMAVKDLLNAKKNRLEMEHLQQIVAETGALEYSEIKKKTAAAEEFLTALMEQQVGIEEKNENLAAKRAELDAEVKGLTEQLKLARSIEGLKKELDRKNSQIIVADETILMESFALYNPTYELMSSDSLKEKLDSVREQQKRMVKNGTAAMGAQSWTVNNSQAQGRKLVKDMIKLCLRSFNNECEAAVKSVRFNNYDRCLQRIESSAESIQKTAKMMQILINSSYVNLKKEELKIALEYQQQKQKEKEDLRELRAQQREEARVAKELEEARKESMKEQKHYQQALDNVNKQISACNDDVEMEVLKARQSELAQKLETIAEEIEQIDYREANQKAGYVYIISNIGAFGENVYKIGMTRRLEPLDRVYELGDASVPFNFDVHAMIFSDDAPALEASLHRTFSDSRLNYVNNRREFFRVTLDEIKAVVKENHDESVEFINVAPAEQYRETMRLRESVIS